MAKHDFDGDFGEFLLKSGKKFIFEELLCQVFGFLEKSLFITIVVFE